MDRRNGLWGSLFLSVMAVLAGCLTGVVPIANADRNPSVDQYLEQVPSAEGNQVASQRKGRARSTSAGSWNGTATANLQLESKGTERSAKARAHSSSRNRDRRDGSGTAATGTGGSGPGGPGIADGEVQTGEGAPLGLIAMLVALTVGGLATAFVVRRRSNLRLRAAALRRPIEDES